MSVVGFCVLFELGSKSRSATVPCGRKPCRDDLAMNSLHTPYTTWTGNADMQRVIRPSLHPVRHTKRAYTTSPEKPPIISIKQGTFYRQHPSPNLDNGVVNHKMFPDLSFTLPSEPDIKSHWAIIGPSNAGKTTLLHILQGKYICSPPTARSHPFLVSNHVHNRHRNVARALRYVGFDGDRGGVGKSGARGAYMSSRYESRREKEDFVVLDYLHGKTELNPAEESHNDIFSKTDFDRIVHDLRLENLLDMPMSNLSNGQIRRARIGKALLGKPLVLLLDEPFMGLDPPTTAALSPMLERLANSSAPRLILALRPQDVLPNWISHLIILGPQQQIMSQGLKDESCLNASMSLSPETSTQYSDSKIAAIHLGLPEPIHNPQRFLNPRSLTLETPKSFPDRASSDDVKVVEMKGVHVKYGAKEILGNWIVKDRPSDQRDGLWWNVFRGERWGVFGPNGR